MISAGTIKMVATGANITPEDFNGHQFLRGSDVAIRGGRLSLANGSMYCGWGRVNTTALGGTLRLRGVTIVPANNNTLTTQGCVLSGTEVTVTVPASDSTLPIFRDDSEVSFDRSTFSGGGQLLMMGSRMSLTITNSVFDNAFVTFDPRDQTDSTSRAIFAFNTVVRTGSIALYRENPSATGNTGTFLNFIENNVLVAGSGTDAVVCPGCSLAHNIVSGQMTALAPSNSVTDPKLVSAAGHDFRLATGSPAIDAAITSPGITTDHDFEGTKRPQGSGADIGAFERLP